MAQQWWEAAPVVAPKEGDGRPAVEFQKPQEPMTAAEAERLALAKAAEARAARSETRAIVKDEMQASKPTQEQGQSGFLVARIKGGIQDIQSILQKAPEAQQPSLIEGVRGSLSPEGLGGLLTRQLAEPERRAVADAQSDMLDAVLTLATGAAYTKEQLQGMSGSYFPQYGDTPEEIRLKNNRLLRAVEAAKLRAGPLAPQLDDVANLFREGGSAQAETAPATPRGQVMGAIQSGELILTDEDRKAGAAIQEAWNRTGKFEDVAAVAAQFGRSFGPEEERFLRANEGKPVNIQANPTGQPTAAEEAVGEFVSTPMGETVAAGALGQANAATFGFLDELAPVLGLDAERVQMAKRYLQQRNPGASLAGEVAGSILPGAAVARGANTLLAGTRAAGLAPAAGDVLSGALAGAGEANESRLGGALLGGAVGGAAGAVGRRVFGGGPDVMPPGGGMPSGGTPMGGGMPGQRVSAGAAATPDEVIRVQRAEELPVPVQLANFQKTRRFEDMQRARELAKDNEVGGPIRERMVQQQAAIAANFDAFLDRTGSEVWSNLEEQGLRITAGLKKMADQSKAKYRALYQRAEKAGELRQPVSYRPVIDFIEQQVPTTQQEKVMRVARELLAKSDPEGTGSISINALEGVRKKIGESMMSDATNAKFGGDLKGIIDNVLNDAGGDVYRASRAAFREHQQTFKEVGAIAQLLGTKRNSTDRVVAAENVVARMLSPQTSADGLRKMKALLIGEGGDPQAWNEVQGALIEQVRRAAYPAAAVKDEAGNVAVSPAGLKRMIDRLDSAGKLDAILDPQVANGLRTLADVAQDVFTAPPGSVNFSNTSSAWVNALDRIINTVVTGLPVSGGVIRNVVEPVRKGVKNRAANKEVRQLLGEPQ